MSPGRTWRSLPALLLAYCLLNLLFFLSLTAYHPVGGELLANGDFSNGLHGWKLGGQRLAVSSGQGVLSLEHERRSSTTLSQCWPRADLPTSMLLSAEARTQGVERGNRPWHMARIDLVGYDSAGKGQYQVRTRLLNLEGDTSWQSARALIQPLASAQRVCLEISLYSAPGRFQVRQLSLLEGKASPLFALGRWVLLAGWAVMALALLRPLYRHYRGHSLGRWLLWTGGLLLAGILMPRGWRDRLETLVLEALERVGLAMGPDNSLGVGSPWSLWPDAWGLSKLAHLVGFALLAALLSSDRQLRLGQWLGWLLLLALTTEVLQFFVPMRTTRLSDLVVDGLGMLIGLCLGWVLARLSSRSKAAS